MSDEFKKPPLDECRRMFREYTHDEMVQEHCRVLNLFHKEIEMNQRIGRFETQMKSDLRRDLGAARDRILELENEVARLQSEAS